MVDVLREKLEHFPLTARQPLGGPAPRVAASAAPGDESARVHTQRRHTHPPFFHGQSLRPRWSVRISGHLAQPRTVP